MILRINMWTCKQYTFFYHTYYCWVDSSGYSLIVCSSKTNLSTVVVTPSINLWKTWGVKNSSIVCESARIFKTVRISGDLKSRDSISCTTPAPLNEETVSISCTATSPHPPPPRISTNLTTAFPTNRPSPQIMTVMEWLRILYEVLREVHTIRICIHHCNDENSLCQWLNMCKNGLENVLFWKKWAKFQTKVQKYSKVRRTEDRCYIRESWHKWVSSRKVLKKCTFLFEHQHILHKSTGTNILGTLFLGLQGSGDGTTTLCGHLCHTKVQPLAVQRQYLYFSVTFRPWVLFWPLGIEPTTYCSAVKHSTELLTELILAQSANPPMVM